MNADGMPSLWVQTVCVYSVRGLLESTALAGCVSESRHAIAQKERTRLPAREDRMRTRLSDTTSAFRLRTWPLCTSAQTCSRPYIEGSRYRVQARKSAGIHIALPV